MNTRCNAPRALEEVKDASSSSSIEPMMVGTVLDGSAAPCKHSEVAEPIEHGFAPSGIVFRARIDAVRALRCGINVVAERSNQREGSRRRIGVFETQARNECSVSVSKQCVEGCGNAWIAEGV